MRGLGRVLVAVALIAGLSGCGRGQASFGGEDTNTVITFSISLSEQERPAIRELVRRFQDQTKAKVNLQLLTRFRSQPASRVDLVTSLNAAQLTARLKADVAARAPSIHLFAQDNLALKDLVDGQLVEDLSGLQIPDAVVDSMIPPKFDGKQLFLPFRPNVRVAYVDRQLLDQVGAEAPRTVEELGAVARRLKEATGRAAVTLSLAEGDPAAVTVSEWIVSHGGDPLVLNDEGSRRAFQALQRLWQEGLLARDSLFAKFDTEVANLASGRASLAQNWSFTSAVLAEQQQTFAAIQHALEDGWFRPVVAYWPDASAAMNEAVDRILLRNEPVGPVLDDLHGRVRAAALRDGARYPP